MFLRELQDCELISLFVSSNGRVHEQLLVSISYVETHLVEVEFFEALLAFTASAIPQTIKPTARM